MYSVGNEDLLNRNPIAIYCSRNTNPSLHEPTLELLQQLMSQPVTLAGGWQSPLEKEALALRKAGSDSNLIYFLAKGIQNFKLPPFLRSDVDKGKVLFVSRWMNEARIDREKVGKRDDLMLSKIDRFLFLNIEEGGNLEDIFFRCLSQEKEVFLFDHPVNQNWMNPEVDPVSSDNLASLVETS